MQQGADGAITEDHLAIQQFEERSHEVDVRNVAKQLPRARPGSK
jgi:hypothetical protein